MLYRLANVIGWTGNAIAALCAIGAAMAFFMPRGDPTAGVLLVFFGVPVFLVARGVRYVLAG